MSPQIQVKEVLPGPEGIPRPLNNHPKKDLNFDGCTNPGNPSVCKTPEYNYSRFDFNGSGSLSPNGAVDTILGTQMTSLQMFASLFGTDAKGALVDTEGWTRSDLPRLLDSGDIEIHAEDLFTAGATSVAISIRRPDTGEAFPARTMNQVGLPIIVTSPLGPGSTTLEVRASAVVDGKTQDSIPRQVTLLAGQDTRMDLCGAHLTLSSDHPELPLDGTTQAKITATITSACADDVVANVPVTITPDMTAVTTFAQTALMSDSKGKVLGILTAGTVSGVTNLGAIADLGQGHILSAKLVVKSAQLMITYAWQETILDFRQNGSSRWFVPSGHPLDCTQLGTYFVIGDFWCINSFHAELSASQPPLLPRSGTLRQVAGTTNFVLTETAPTSLIRYGLVWQTSTGVDSSPVPICLTQFFNCSPYDFLTQTVCPCEDDKQATRPAAATEPARCRDVAGHAGVWPACRRARQAYRLVREVDRAAARTAVSILR